MYNFSFLECEKARDRNLKVMQMREIYEARGPYLEKKKKKRKWADQNTYFFLIGSILYFV